MADDIGKVYTPAVIADMPFPQEGDTDLNPSQTTGGGLYSPLTIKDKKLPKKRVATELLSSALNTRSKKILQPFEFTRAGALQIGEYEAGISGDIRISPNGIVARNSSGNTTISIDGDTGDAIFAGLIQAGSVIAGQVIVGNNTWIIDGDEDNPNIALYDDDGNIAIYLGEV